MLCLVTQTQRSGLKSLAFDTYFLLLIKSRAHSKRGVKGMYGNQILALILHSQPPSPITEFRLCKESRIAFALLLNITYVE